jgi:hypothetical protein
MGCRPLPAAGDEAGVLVWDRLKKGEAPLMAAN